VGWVTLSGVFHSKENSYCCSRRVKRLWWRNMLPPGSTSFRLIAGGTLCSSVLHQGEAVK